MSLSKFMEHSTILVLIWKIIEEGGGLQRASYLVVLRGHFDIGVAKRVAFLYAVKMPRVAPPPPPTPQEMCTKITLLQDRSCQK